MRSTLTLLPLAAAVGILLSGCASKAERPDPDAVPFEVTTFTPDQREHHTSWGHTGRGGAALRKPAYQPVLGSPDTLETRYGKLHPELQPRPAAAQAAVQVPPAMYADKCAEPGAANSAAQAFPLPSSQEAERITTLANSRGSVDDYIRVRDKLCKGAMRLTYEEWQILVEGTPKDLPLHLQHKSSTRN